MLVQLLRIDFGRAGKAGVGTRFFDYLTRLRMRHAREHLTATGLRVWEIAERVGYTAEVSFVNAFKKIHGQTPRQYRLRAAGRK